MWGLLVGICWGRLDLLRLFIGSYVAGVIDGESNLRQLALRGLELPRGGISARHVGLSLFPGGLLEELVK